MLWASNWFPFGVSPQRREIFLTQSCYRIAKDLSYRSNYNEWWFSSYSRFENNEIHAFFFGNPTRQNIFGNHYSPCVSTIRIVPHLIKLMSSEKAIVQWWSKKMKGLNFERGKVMNGSSKKGNSCLLVFWRMEKRKMRDSLYFPNRLEKNLKTFNNPATYDYVVPNMHQMNSNPPRKRRFSNIFLLHFMTQSMTLDSVVYQGKFGISPCKRRNSSENKIQHDLSLSSKEEAVYSNTFIYQPTTGTSVTVSPQCHQVTVSWTHHRVQSAYAALSWLVRVPS